MSPILKRIAMKLVLTVLCCMAAGAFVLGPASNIGGSNRVCAAGHCYYNWEYWYYNDANHSYLVGYKSCLGVWGYQTPYYFRQMIVCGGPECQDP